MSWFRGRALVLVLAMAACSGGAAGSSGPAPVAADPERGRALYDRYCALCHGAGGAGYAADNASQLRNPTFLRTASDDFLRAAIERGRPGTPMAAFGTGEGGPLGAAEIADLIGYLRSLDRGPQVEVHRLVVQGDAGRGAEIYQDRCAECHGARGEGGTAPSLSNPSFLASASDGFVRYAIEHGRPGTPMEPFGGLLTAQEIDDLTATIRSWSRGTDQSGPRPSQLPGLDRIVTNPHGPAPGFSPLREGRFVPADELAAAIKAGARLVLLDARPTSDWHKGHIPGAHPTPFYDDLDEIASALPKSGTWIISYCACPHAASGKVVDALRARGFAQTAVLDEGINVWKQRGYPIATSAPAPR
jgi:mono/diheme cytochrome c family protein/rhodanese-related sulfurtransferase